MKWLIGLVYRTKNVFRPYYQDRTDAIQDIIKAKEAHDGVAQKPIRKAGVSKKV